jgi:hypothetical protein
MRAKLTVVLAVLGILIAVVHVPAHHAFGSEFDVEQPVALKGTVTMMEWVNPHSWIHIDVKKADGTVENWAIEGGSPNALLRLGFTKNALLPDMEIAVEGYRAKDASTKAVGKSLMFADGRKLFLGGSEPGGRGAH